MAANLEEALVSFPDLSLLNPPDPVDTRNPAEEQQVWYSQTFPTFAIFNSYLLFSFTKLTRRF